MTNHDSLPPQAPPAASPRPTRVERVSGRGQVLRDGVAVLDVDYDLAIAVPAATHGVSPSAEPAVPAPDISGQLDGPLYTGEQLPGVHTLVLADGRAFDFRVIQPDTNEIVGVSELREPGVAGRGQ